MTAIRPSTRHYRDLFEQYPLATETVGPRQEMTLVSPDGQLTRLSCPGNFYVLGPGRPLRQVRDAIPFPADGQLYGWVDRDEEIITGLISVYNPYDGPGGEGKDGDGPSVSVMPLAGLPAERWPQIASEAQFGSWFWTEYRAGRIILLDKAIPHFPVCLWSVAHPAGSCILALISFEVVPGVEMPAGVYAPAQALREGTAPARADLDDLPWTDLAACFAGPESGSDRQLA